METKYKRNDFDRLHPGTCKRCGSPIYWGKLSGTQKSVPVVPQKAKGYVRHIC